jgi:ATP-dependent Clp protease ATP-binding subunit ClpA
MSNFDRFSERTRSVLAYAHEEARSLNQHPINTGHLLLSLLDEPNGVIPRVLQPLKVSVLALRVAVQAVVEFGNAELEGDGLSREAQQALRLAIEESQRLGRDLVEPEHVLLGLIGQDDGIAARQLQRYGATLEHAQDRVASVPGQIPTDLTFREYQRRLEASTRKEEEPQAPLIREGTSVFTAFTERARKALQLAQDEAQRFNHDYIGTEHLLLGLVREGDGVAARVLNNMGVQLPKVRSALEFIIGRGEDVVIGDIGLTPRSKKVLELAVDESRRLKHDHVGTEHILLGLVREGEGIAAGVLESLGVNLEKVRAQVVKTLEGPSGKYACGSLSGAGLGTHTSDTLRKRVRARGWPISTGSLSARGP